MAKTARGRKRPKKKQMTPREQALSLLKVAKISFETAPGSVLFKLFGAFVNALLPIATAYFAALTTTVIVGAIGGDEVMRGRAILYIVVTAVLGLIGTGWNSIDQYIQASMRYRVESKVSDRMYEHFLSLEFWRYDDKETIDLYDKAQKFAQFFAWIFDRLSSVISQLITMVASIAALFVINRWLALAVFIAILPGVYLQFKLSRAEVAHWNENVETRRARNMIEWDLLQPKTAIELRLYGLVRYLLDLRIKLRDMDEKIRIQFERQFIGRRLIANGIQALAEVGSLIWITLEVIAHRQPIGQFVYVQQVVSRAISGASGFIDELSRIDEDVANLFEYEQFMTLERPKRHTQKILTAPDTITFEDVSFHYPNSSQTVLSNISFIIRKLQHVAIVGENGAGKTTLVKLLAALYEPTDGRVLLDGKEFSTITTSSWHAQLAVLNQDFTKFTFTNARDNIRFGDVEKNNREALQTSLMKAEATQFIEKLPRGLNTVLNPWIEDKEGNPGVDLSGGQWQRLALARNFYRDAPVIILDEPTSAIDALAESRIFKRLFSDKTKTIIAISHRLTTIKKADVIYMMQTGRIVEQGTYEELIARKGAFYHMFEAQL